MFLGIPKLSLQSGKTKFNYFFHDVRPFISMVSDYINLEPEYILFRKIRRIRLLVFESGTSCISYPLHCICITTYEL